MGLERGDGDTHPVVKRQTVELALALGPVEPDDLALAGRERLLPESDEMAFMDEARRGGCLSALACLDLGLRSSDRDVELKLDQELHGVLLRVAKNLSALAHRSASSAVARQPPATQSAMMDAYSAAASSHRKCPASRIVSLLLGKRSSRNSALASGTTLSRRPAMI